MTVAHPIAYIYTYVLRGASEGRWSSFQRHAWASRWGVPTFDSESELRSAQAQDFGCLALSSRSRSLRIFLAPSSQGWMDLASLYYEQDAFSSWRI